MSEQKHGFTSAVLPLLKANTTEVGILAVCLAVINTTGQTKGPVFDIVGPDMLPWSVAVIVGALCILQIAINVTRHVRGATNAGSQVVERLDGRATVYFAALAVVYALALSSGLTSFAILTAVFVLIATLIVAKGVTRKDLVLGALVGVGLGFGLQIIFTRVLFIDLPT